MLYKFILCVLIMLNLFIICSYILFDWYTIMEMIKGSFSKFAIFILDFVV